MKRTCNSITYLRISFLLVCICAASFCNGQLCLGSLGDPAVNITFGSGNTGNPGVTSPGYIYTTSSCPNDGYFTITNSTSGCFSNNWHTVSSDHTGNGAFMLVNASNQPGDFILTTVTGLCSNTTYEFAAWIMNVLVSPAGIMPNITFSIETPSGTILNQFNTGDISATALPLWTQYGFFFTTTAGNSSVVLRMTNNAPGGNGNDLALDDITFRPCGPVLNCTIQAGNNQINVCVNEQPDYIFTATASAGYLSPVFQWQVSTDSSATWRNIPGANSLMYQRSPAQAGDYWYRIIVAESGNQGVLACSINSNILKINVEPRPVISAGPDRFIIAGGNTVLAAQSNGGNLAFVWSPPDYLSNITILNPVASPDRDMTYTILATSQNGCKNTDEMQVKLVTGFFVPTAFTPNNNGKNDSWRIPFIDPSWGVTVSVYNRYGQIVYEHSGTTVNWNGNLNGVPQPSGIYVYLIRFTNGIPDVKGTLSLIR